MTQADTSVGDGLLIVDKPSDWTSHDVVGRARRLCATRKVGHAGTLDPMATGVLVLGVNRATKLLTYLVGRDKTYEATIRLGQATLTDDAEGEVTEQTSVRPGDLDGLAGAIAELTGPIEQVPSAVSAIKVKGQRSYARVRAGEDVELPARPVTVHRFDMVGDPRPSAAESAPPLTYDLDVRVEVSSGTYVRALARDLGARLGVGGHLVSLRRTGVGEFTLDRAATLEQVATEGPAARLIPMATAAAAMFPVRRLTRGEVRGLRFGQWIEREPGVGKHPEATAVAALGPDGDLVALLDTDSTTAADSEESARQVRSLVVFPEV